MGISNQSSSKFGRTSRTGCTNPASDFPLRRRIRSIRRDERSLQDTLQPLIQDQVQGRLSRTEVTRAETLVQTAKTFLTKDLADAVETILVPAVSGTCLSLVELQTSLHEPDGICCGGGGNAGGDSGLRVDEC